MVAPPEVPGGFDGTYNHRTRRKPPGLSMETLQRTISDISWELSNKDHGSDDDDNHHSTELLPSIPEVENAKCECCGLSEECTPEYIGRVRSEFSGKLICGLCSEAVNREMEKNGGKREEAVAEHMNACIRFNRMGRAFPVLCQAEEMREVLKRNRAKSLSPRVKVVAQQRKGGKISRSSSCVPAFAKDIKESGLENI